jgi:renalase
MKLAIIGAGMAGLAAARQLQQRFPELEITIYEKSRSYGGRAATRRRANFVFDHGAQYLKAPTPALVQLITRELPQEELFDIAKPVWVFDGAGTIAEGDPAQNADPKWSYRSGLNLLGKLLAKGVNVRQETRIGALHATNPGWQLIDDHNTLVGDADFVLLTPPAPQSADLLQSSNLPAEVKSALSAALAPAHYRRCLSLAFGYTRIIHRPFYALVNNDRKHPVSWLALEHEKGSSRCPANHSLLIAQLAPQASQEYWDLPLEQLSSMVAGWLGDILAEDLDEPLWADRQGWRYALPDGRCDVKALDMPELGLFFAGDFTAGQGRVHLAIEEGWRAATTIEQVYMRRTI